MICATCIKAAKKRLPASAHCKSKSGEGASCFCQHRTDRYRPKAKTKIKAVEELTPGLITYSGPL